MIKMDAVLAWTRQEDLVFQTPLIRLAILPLLKAMLPPLGVTPEQMTVLDEHYEDLVAREAEARRRSL
jgi:hypothetical protein